jgi:carboxypeptidase Q
MKKLSFLLLAALIPAAASAQSPDSVMIRKIYTEILSNGKCYSNLDYLTNKIGGRISGSAEAQKAVEWTFKAMKDAGADTVFLQECMVPHWVRGAKESAKIISKGASKEVPVCALGGSIATPAAGITAQVVELHGLGELAGLPEGLLKGKIVFFNGPMDPALISTFDAYGKAVGQRWAGAMEAVKQGAIGVVVRSMTPAHDDNPHTGSMGYDEKGGKIPACAISTNAADLLSKMLKDDPSLKFYFRQSCQTLPDVKSYNVVGEIRGSEKKNEFLVAGGHLDSWDTGKGAHDDGSGIVQSIEILRTFQALGIRPKRTIRVVAFMNEENGGRGGDKYAELAQANKENHIAALESDRGGFTPRGFSFTGPKEKKDRLLLWKPLFLPYGVYDFSEEGGGSDIEPLQAQGVPVMEIVPDSQRYFDYHHTPVDTFDKISKRELDMGAATMAAMMWLISEYGL